MKKQLLTAAIIAAASAGVSAEQYWADNSFSLLKGDDYKLAPNGRLNTLTIEHVSGHSWGGVFLFVDRHVGQAAPGKAQFKETYGEFSPKFNLVQFENSVVKNVNAAFTYEFSSASNGVNQDNYLVGFGTDLAIPGMDFASATYYYADNENTKDDHQITLTYGWHMGDFNIDGYIDYSTGASDHDAQFHFNPQLTYNVGPLLKTDNKVKVGVEYSYWNNKFGIKDMDSKLDEQNAFSLLLKVHL